MQSAFEEELQRSSDSLTENQKTKLCNSLLHKIRIIQGETNLNYNEPHFMESKESIGQTKDLINSIKEGVRKGCSDIIRSAKERARFSSDTNSSLAGNETFNKKRQLKSLLGEVEKSAEKDEAKIEVKRTKNFPNNAQYEGGERPEIVSTARISQTTRKDNEKGMQMASDVVGESKMAKRKKRRKRKMDEIEITSSMTITQSKVHFTEGDSRPVRLKPRKNRDRYANRKRQECSGDESDIEEDTSSRINGISIDRVKFPRRRLRVKCPQIRSSSSGLTQNERDIREMVSSTIDKLNNVNNHVKRVIEGSLSSEASFVLEKPTITNSRKIVGENARMTGAENVSGTSLNWSTTTISKSTLIDVVEPNRSVQTPASARKHSQTQATIECKLADDDRIPLQIPPPPPPTAKSAASGTAVVERVAPARPKRKKHKNDAPKVETEMIEVVPAKEAPKKKKSNVSSKPVNPAEPVSSLKKCGKKKKDKKKEHVNFVSSPPEIVPDYQSNPVPPIPSKKSVNMVYATPNENQKQHKNPPKSVPQENTAPAPVSKPTHKASRRISSAKTCRSISKKDLPKVRSTGNLDSMHTEVSSVTVRSVLEEEASNERRRTNSKTRNRSGSRGRASRSKSGSKNENRPRSKSGSRKEESMLRSREVRDIYYKIRTNTTNTIANINEQMSSTLKESIAHLNDICGKVRNTLTDMEKDEQTYKRLKSKQSFEVSSEGGGSTISVQANKVAKINLPGKSGDKLAIKSHTYTVITQPCQDSSIGQLINTISMGGDNFLEDTSHVEVPTATPAKEKKKRKSREIKKRVSSKQYVARPKPNTPTINSSKTKFSNIKKTISNDKTSLTKIPIWQRKPPSVIEEIQLTVKKQATKSQYREFLRALKSIARKQRSQVHVVPQEFREIMEKQQDKAFDSISKHRLVTKKKNNAKPTVELSKVCNDCPQDKCTCGVIVENTITAPNLQRTNWMRIRQDKKGIQVYDILDEITLKDVEPIQSEYPRKDHINDAGANKRVEDTLLYKLLYHEDPKVLELLVKSNCLPVEEQRQAPKLSTSKIHERPMSVSDAYRFYEQLEFSADKRPSLNLTPTKGSICLKSTENLKPKEKPKALETCTKDFDDELVIPDDLKPTMKNQVHSPKKTTCKQKHCHIKLKSDDDVSSQRSRKRIEEKLKIIGKTSSIKSIDRRNRKIKFSKENIKTRLKNYNTDSKYKIKNILMVMPVSIIRNKHRLKRGNLVNVEKSKRQRELKISAENMEQINSMTKREIVKILKPYIFFDLQPPVITVMPVSVKYNHQNKNQRLDHNTNTNKRPTFKKVMGYLKEHDEDCHSGKKLCRRCQMLMQSGDETAKKNETTGTTKFEPLSQKQLWKNKYKPTAAETLINRVLGKKASRKKFQTVPPDERTNSQEVVVTMTPRELNRNAANTRSKLKEVRNIMESHKPLLGQHLDEVIDALEFRIVDALSNPKNQHSDAFNEIEFEIKNILSTISELKEINQEHIRINNVKLKSKTTIELEDSSTSRSEMKSKTDVNLISSVNELLEDITAITKSDEKITPILKESTSGITVEDESCTEDVKEENIDETYSNLGKDIEKVIDGLDAIMSIDKETTMKEEQPVEVVKDIVVESKENNLSSECGDPVTTFCEQMDEVMKNLGSTDDLNVSTDTLDAYITEDIQEKKSDEYLTPFMKAVKSYRRNEQTHNFLEFLDKLTMLSKEPVSLTIYQRGPMHQATIKCSAQVIEVARTYNQVIQCQELVGDECTDVEENFYEANANIDTCSHFKENTLKETRRNDVLSTNQWMQTEEIKVHEKEFEEVKNCLIQTSSTEVQFYEVEEYLEILNDENTLHKTILISEKNTQVPSSLDHTCFAKCSSKEVQVSSDLLEMASVAVGNHTGVSGGEELVKTTASAEYQVGSDIDDYNFTSVEFPENIEEVAAVDMAGMEKYSNRIDSCFGENVSDMSFNECPRTAYTDSCITRKKNNLLSSDLQLCDKANSYPTTRRSSNIISLFESHKSSNDTNYTRDFLEDGFGKSPSGSYDSMLARCASSETLAKAQSCITVQKLQSTPISLNLEERKHTNKFAVKLVGQESAEDYRHKHLLHSVYGIVFVLMFLSINLNYGCYN